MPLFYFDIYNGHADRDSVGTEFETLDLARQDALRASGEILSDKTRVDPEHPWRMVVRDEHDFVVATMTFSVS